MSASFKAAIIERSVADTWVEARKEWKPAGYSHGDTHCICGVHILHVFHCLNTKNGTESIVGSKCVTQLPREDLKYFLNYEYINCIHCESEKSLNVDSPYCKDCKKECPSGLHRMSSRMTYCPVFESCNPHRYGYIPYSPGPLITNPTVIRAAKENDIEELEAASPCVHCMRTRDSLDYPSCSVCRTPIGFGKYRHLTPPALVRRDRDYVRWVCEGTNKTMLIKAIKAIIAAEPEPIKEPVPEPVEEPEPPRYYKCTYCARQKTPAGSLSCITCATPIETENGNFKPYELVVRYPKVAKYVMNTTESDDIKECIRGVASVRLAWLR